MKTIFEPPKKQALGGRTCRLEPLNIENHALPLYENYAQGKSDKDWQSMSYGPFADFVEFENWLKQTCQQEDPLFFVVIPSDTNQASGLLSLLNINHHFGTIEVGHIHFSPNLQRTTAATEAIFLLMNYVFEELQYRRLEWKCDNLNERSKRSAKRLGFQFEGVFRQHYIVKDKNRDTAWFSILDKEWPAIELNIKAWLSPENFDAQGHQISRL